MTRYAMMDKIARTLSEGEKITVNVAHKGSWSGADMYEITPSGYKWRAHIWHACGTVCSVYKSRVLGR